MNILTSALNGLSMYRLMLWFLLVVLAASALLSLAGILPYTWWHIPANLAVFMAFCWAANAGFSRIFLVRPNRESQFITAAILALIVGPLNPLAGWPAMLLVSVMAMGSKYLLAADKKHIFNPAALGVLAGAFILGQGASWWVGSRHLLPLVFLGGLLVLRKLRWLHLAASFFGAYLAALSASLFFRQAPAASVWLAVQGSLLDSALVFFAAVMLVEPLTAPRGRAARMVYGGGMGAGIVLIQSFWPAYAYGLETALLAGNLLAFFTSRGGQRQILKFQNKSAEARDTYSFWFEPVKPFLFRAGQYMEWSVPHKRPDSRGSRRFFTIASSPGRRLLRLATRIGEKPSSFKRALAALGPGDEISAANVDGEFTLPERDQKLAFIAGGIGITPFLSILEERLEKARPLDAVLFYLNKTEPDIAFRDALADAEAIGTKTVYLVDRPSPSWTGLTGPLTPEILKKHLPDFSQRLFYLSGPEPMVEAYERLLSGLGIKKNRIKRDYFPGYPG